MTRTANDTANDTATDLSNPYIGPVPFETRQKDLFFGREEEAEMLLSLVISERIVVFYAPSGAGKSSLLNARLIPRLREKGYTVLRSVRVGGDLPPGMSAIQVKNVFLFNAVYSLIPIPNPGSLADEDLHSVLTDSEFRSILESEHLKAKEECRRVEQASAQATPGDSDSLEPEEASRGRYIILDQFEELFTNHIEHWEKREDFFKQLRSAMEADSKLNLIFVLREDYLAELSNYTHLLPENMRVRFRMERLKYTVALDAITGPAETRGCAFETGIAEKLRDDLRKLRKGVIETVASELREQQIAETAIQEVAQRLRQGEAKATIKEKLSVELPKIGVKAETVNKLLQDTAKITTLDDVFGEYVEPVYLQIVCFQLWEGLQLEEPRKITSHDLARCGDATKALTRFYEDCIAHVVKECKALNKAGEIEQWKDQDKDEEAEIRRWFSEVLITPSRVRAQVNKGDTESEGLPDVAVERLIKQNLIRVEKARGGEWLELAHDRLIMPILDANRKWFSERESPLAAAARIWNENQRDRSFLYRGTRLTNAQTYYDQNKDSMNKLAGEFITASVARQAYTSRGLRAAVVLLLIFLVLAIWFAFKAIVQENRAEAQALIALQALGDAGKAAEEERKAKTEALNNLTALKRVLKASNVQSDLANQIVSDDNSKALDLFTLATKERQKLLESTDAAHRALITVQYYEKDNDPGVIKASLQELGFKYESKEGMIPKASNTIWAGNKVTADEIKLIAFSLIRAGVELKCIELRSKPDWEYRVQVGHDRNNESNSNLKIEDVQRFSNQGNWERFCGSAP